MTKTNLYHAALEHLEKNIDLLEENNGAMVLINLAGLDEGSQIGDTINQICKDPYVNIAIEEPTVEQIVNNLSWENISKYNYYDYYKSSDLIYYFNENSEIITKINNIIIDHFKLEIDTLKKYNFEYSVEDLFGFNYSMSLKNYTAQLTIYFPEFDYYNNSTISGRLIRKDILVDIYDDFDKLVEAVEILNSLYTGE